MVMSKFNFAVLISGSGSNLQAMIDAIDSKIIDGSICCVLSNNPDAYGLKRAKKADIPVEVINHKEFTSREEFDEAMIKRLYKYKPKLVVLSGFMRILSQVFVNQFHGRLLNIHPSLLPKYPGLNTHQRVLDSGDKYHGVTIHFVDTTLDGGPICAQSQLLVKTKSAEKLQNQIHDLEHSLYPKVIDWFSKKRLKLVEGIAYLDNKPIKI
tara:strand:- start:5874 stop:6503 length:630 start_codon:yes stop_codon:yes gene_type:complete